jgi:hypothetical protein
MSQSDSTQLLINAVQSLMQIWLTKNKIHRSPVNSQNLGDPVLEGKIAHSVIRKIHQYLDIPQIRYRQMVKRKDRVGIKNQEQLHVIHLY